MESSAYQNQNLYIDEPKSHLVILPRLPTNCRQLPAAEHPFSTKKNVLRKLSGRNDLYFKPSSFHENTSCNQTVCLGSVWRKKLTRNESDGRNVFVRLNGTLYELEQVYTEEKCISLDNLHYSNDYIFAHGARMFLLEWIF